LVDEGPALGRPTITLPLEGRFLLRQTAENPLFTYYAWETIAWSAGGAASTSYKITGQGTYQIGGEVALIQDLYLEVDIDSGWTNRRCYFTITNGVPLVSRLWPMIQVSVDQTNGLPVQQFHLDLVAAPLREIWFSTANGLHAGIWQWPTNQVSAGDLLGSSGRIVKRNTELTRQLGLMPMVPDLGLDAADILAGGEIAFALEQDVFSETLGPLSSGDVLTDQGRIMTNQAALLGAFGLKPPAENQGLDALQVMPSGEIYFSVTNDFYSPTLGRAIRRGDLLSSSGTVVRNNEDLVAQFQPADPKQDYGLDALYVWSSGEIWFSVETGFYGQHFEGYRAGDLLSDQGEVIYRNLDLVGALQPLEDLADFGLDALYVVTDAVPPPSTAPQCAVTQADGGRAVTLRWDGPGHTYQVERTADLLGSWSPASPILTDREFTDALGEASQAFYRIRQW
jgi:hypothetical protein